jgi:hypothetical protein
MRRLAGLACVAGVVAACSSSSSPSSSPAQSSQPPPVVKCDSTAATTPTDAFALADVRVALDSTDPLLTPVRADLASYLGAMWGGPVDVASSPSTSSKVSVWISSSTEAQAALGTAIADGYVLRRIDAGGRTTLVVYAPDAANLAAGAYALLEELGARFFHPKQELVPKLGAPRLPRTLDVWRRPMARTRGLQTHTLHPIEYMTTFMEPSAANLADAKLLIDWLVKTGQNYLLLPLLATVDWTTWKPYAKAFMDYGHSRGVRFGAGPEVLSQSALQNNFVLISDLTRWATQLTSQIDVLMQLPWDGIRLFLGEFVSASSGPQSVIDWLDYATEYVTSKYPGVEIDVENHVGNYPQLWVSYDDQTVYYYHLPEFCDVRLGQMVHTLSLFDMYRDWATYAHPNFHLQHDYLLGELASRRVSYSPESAYWISADIDVPAFLPEHLYARWLDIHTLDQEITARGLPPLDGHIEFTSGHEWGYWLTDYLVARMLWQPQADLGTILQAYTSAFGSCAGDVQGALASYVDLQTSYLFDQRLLPYIQGENATVELGYLAGLETHPERVEFAQILKMTPAQLSSFEKTVIDGLDAFASKTQPLLDAVAARCRGADATIAPWCDELRDGMQIVQLRAQHASLVYRAVVAYRRGDTGTPPSLLAQATQITQQAAAVVAAREAHYRFDVTRLTGQYANPTVYSYGYLREAHTQCYWTRREQEVQYILQNGTVESISQLPKCG